MPLAVEEAQGGWVALDDLRTVQDDHGIIRRLEQSAEPLRAVPHASDEPEDRPNQRRVQHRVEAEGHPNLVW